MSFNPFQERPRAQLNNPFSLVSGSQNYSYGTTNISTNYSTGTNYANSQLYTGIDQKGTMEVNKYNYHPLYETINSKTECTGVMITLTALQGFDKYSTAELRSIDYRNRKNGFWNNVNSQNNATASMNPFLQALSTTTPLNWNANTPFVNNSQVGVNQFNLIPNSSNSFNMINNNPFNTTNNNPFSINNNSSFNMANNNMGNYNQTQPNNMFIPSSSSFNTNNNKFIINANAGGNAANTPNLNQSIISNVTNIPLNVNPLSFSFGPTNTSTQMNATNQSNQPRPSPLYYIQPYFDLKSNHFFNENCSPIIREPYSDHNITSLIKRLNSSTANLNKENNKEALGGDNFEVPEVKYLPSSLKPFPLFEKTTTPTPYAVFTKSREAVPRNAKRGDSNIYHNSDQLKDDHLDQFSHGKGLRLFNNAITNQMKSKASSNNYYQSSDYLREIELLGNEACSTLKYNSPSKYPQSNSISSQEPPTFLFNKAHDKEDNTFDRPENQSTPIKAQLNSAVLFTSSIKPVTPLLLRLSFQLNQSMLPNSSFQLDINQSASIEDLKASVIQKLFQLHSVRLQANQISFYNSQGVIDKKSQLKDETELITINISEYASLKDLRVPRYPTMEKYQTVPTKQEIMAMSFTQLSQVKELTIFNEHGRITFKEQCDLNGVNIDQIITIKPYYLSCYIGVEVPPRGTELNKPARIEIFSIQAEEADMTQEDWTKTLKETVKQLGGVFIDYLNGTLTFDVEHFNHNK